MDKEGGYGFKQSVDDKAYSALIKFGELLPVKMEGW